MKELNFNPYKKTGEFKKNYELHDASEKAGKQLLIEWGFEIKNFGEDLRNKRVWEGGEDKPDIIISYNGMSALLDWKAKNKPVWILNKRAFMSYKLWQQKMNMPALIFFGLFNSKKELIDSRIASINKHSYIFSSSREWDKNETVEFEQDLPRFSKENLLKILDLNQK